MTVRGCTTENAQLKYYGAPEDTAKAISHPKYATLDQKVVPSDQLEVREGAAAVGHQKCGNEARCLKILRAHTPYNR